MSHDSRVAGVHNNNNINCGIRLLENNRLEEAYIFFSCLCEQNPKNVDAWYFLSCIHGMQGNMERAGYCCRRVIALRPTHSDAHANMGNVLFSQGNLEDAVLHYQKSLRSNPRNVLAHNNLGNALKEQGHFNQAIKSYQRAIKLRPEYIMAYNNLAITLRSQGRLEDAEKVAKKALKLQPEHGNSWTIVGNINVLQGKVESALDAYQNALRLDPSNTIAHSDFLMAMHYCNTYSVEGLFQEAISWNSAHHSHEACLPSPSNPAQADRRLRVGYVSGDFCNHPVGYFIESVLSHHDRSKYEIFCYYNNIRCDDLTARLQQSCDRWQNIMGQADQTVARKIREDNIDILVDLSGHSSKNRLLSFAHKPAPIQATWLGYHATTGLHAMDYIIGDKYLIPPEEEQYYVERVLRLPNAYLCFSPPDSTIEPGPLPAPATGKITFGCFNNPAKLTEKVIACWSRLLHALPQAQLFLKYRSFADDGVRRRYQDLFAANGVDLTRLRFAGASPRQEYLAAYQQVDIALDPFPFNGCTTTLESLWMGVPVVTLRGDRYVGHMGETILRHLGLEEDVTDSEDDYIARAIALTSDLPSLTELRSGLRNRLLNSSLCDGPVFTQYLEAAYRSVWEIWCQTCGQ